VRTYGQYCPIARGAEIFAERWTPLIIHNLYLGCGTFSEILEGAPGLSRTLLAQRLKQLERLGIVESAPKPDGRGRHYQLTTAGHGLFKVCVSLGEWGAAWLEIAPEHLAPLWPCGRCATCSAETGSRIDASSSASTSPAANAPSGTGC
jgi:DNA-binding HxlR family transcriptional regulator